MTDDVPSTRPYTPEDLARCLQVLAALHEVDVEHPDYRLVEQAAAHLTKTAKKRRRVARAQRAAAADRSLLATTHSFRQSLDRDELATVGPGRSAGPVGQLVRQRRCYVCKAPFREVDPTYHQLCAACSAENADRREARADLTGRRALVTGGRIKIGYQVALKLLRDGAHVTITTRFATDACRRFADEPDVDAWRDRLRVVAVDFLDGRAVDLVIADLVADGQHLDILVNNAAQTVRRPAAYHRALVAGEAAAAGADAFAVRRYAGQRNPLPIPDADRGGLVDWLFPNGQVDETGEPLDRREVNSWVLHVDEVDPAEYLEAHVVTTFVPFLLCARLKPLLLASPFPDRYVINVSAVEGQFNVRNKSERHPHTNMAKAGLNMLTRTTAADFARDGIFMSAVDTGWVTDENPQPTKQRLRDRGFRTPLDVVDGAARVYDPIVRGVRGEPVWGAFLKDYAVAPW